MFTFDVTFQLCEVLTPCSSFQVSLNVVQPPTLLAGITQLPPAQLNVFFAAMMRLLDDTVLLAMRSAHDGALPAATAVQLLAEVLAMHGHQENARWAVTTGCERMRRIIATPECPPPVRLATTHALGRLQQLG